MLQALFASENLLCDSIAVEALPAEHATRVGKMFDTDLFRKTFQPPTALGLIEIDKLVVTQRTVNLEYVEKLVAEMPAAPSVEDLITLCLSPDRPLAPVQHLELEPNAHVFSSLSGDFRFLGAFLKELAPDDLKYAQNGGVPAAAIISFVGYGAYPVSVYSFGNRAILGNGLHRVYALRSMGVKKIPAVIQRVSNPQLDFPATLFNIPREYLLGDGRPVLMKDFFEGDFTTIVKVRKRLRVVSLQVAAGQHDVPS